MRQTFWIVAAMVGARSAAMSMNRIADLRFDRDNPRTASRPLPSGRLSVAAAWNFMFASAAFFVFAAAMLNRFAFILSFVALGIFLFYSFSKRFTVLTHLVLGLALSGAPLGGWIAIRGSVEGTPFLLGSAVLFWVAGFDIIYSCQDFEYDRKAGLFSIPAWLGVRRALWMSRGFHAVMVVFLLALVPVFGLGPVWIGGVLATAALLGYEHTIVRYDDLSRVNRAFFTVNGWVGFLLLVCALVDLHLGK
jgi:4-hydroxybenzoate polyprenyltransferase